ncbi:MAG: hypothetical protein KDA89_09365 [Planctomycetaceae bacterium]|nr:hypothetical protein [Planctomycetaceae bacterium]
MAMKKSQFDEWLRGRVEFQRKVTIGGCAAMAAVALIAFLLQGGLLYILLAWGYGRAAAIVSLLLIFGGMGIYTFLTAPKQLCDSLHDVTVDDRTVQLRIAPTMAAAWTYGLGSLDSDQSIPERIFGLLMVVPRMLWTSMYVGHRVQDVQAINVADCGRVLRFVLKKAERVNAAEIAEKFPDIDLTGILRQVSLIDGVVFLTKESVGLSLANRFRDDLEQGLRSAE